MTKLRLVYVQGVEGNSISLNDRRIAGPKPWGGGRVLKEWEVDVDDLMKAIPKYEAMQKVCEAARNILKCDWDESSGPELLRQTESLLNLQEQVKALDELEGK